MTTCCPSAPMRPGGRVTSPDATPLADVELDMWQADAEGLYSNIHPNIPEWNLRGRFHSGSDGTFEVRTIVPPPYEIPKGGPTGVVLSTLGRHLFRPAHLHLKVRHPQYRDLTSQLYFDGGDYLNSDVANAVREGLVAQLIRRDDPNELAALGCTNLISKSATTSSSCRTRLRVFAGEPEEACKCLPCKPRIYRPAFAMPCVAWPRPSAS
ncbi:MAG: hypothetical protein CR217_10635 [Beijerinckiaceae bacterium]|nr:MAG: hypothetical protein CR217_10635 [Beijerinckiaceae bacterium]